MALVVPIEGLGGERVSKREEVCVVAALVAQSQLALQKLIVQHGLHSLTSDIPAAWKFYGLDACMGMHARMQIGAM